MMQISRISNAYLNSANLQNRTLADHSITPHGPSNERWISWSGSSRHSAVSSSTKPSLTNVPPSRSKEETCEATAHVELESRLCSRVRSGADSGSRLTQLKKQHSQFVDSGSFRVCGSSWFRYEGWDGMFLFPWFLLVLEDWRREGGGGTIANTPGYKHNEEMRI